MARFQVSPISPAAVADARRRFSNGDPTVEERIVDAPTGYPCRITLEEARRGERVLLFRHRPFASDGPYAEEGPVFARLESPPAQLGQCELPPFLANRKLVSVKRYDARHAIAGAEVVNPEECGLAISRALDDQEVAYVHVRNAGYGCFLFRADRV